MRPVCKEPIFNRPEGRDEIREREIRCRSRRVSDFMPHHSSFALVPAAPRYWPADGKLLRPKNAKITKKRPALLTTEGGAAHELHELTRMNATGLQRAEFQASRGAGRNTRTGKRAPARCRPSRHGGITGRGGRVGVSVDHCPIRVVPLALASRSSSHLFPLSRSPHLRHTPAHAGQPVSRNREFVAGAVPG
jgi:hypothetical protein